MIPASRVSIPTGSRTQEQHCNLRSAHHNDNLWKRSRALQRRRRKKSVMMTMRKRQKVGRIRGHHRRRKRKLDDNEM